VARPEAGAVFTFKHAAPVRKVLWLDGAMVVTGGDDGALRLWDVRVGAAAGGAAATFSSGAAAVMDVERSADGATLTVAAGRSVLLLDARTLAPRARHDFGYEVETASLFPGGGRFACGGTDVHVHVHDAVTGAEVAVERGHHGTVHAVRVAPDGRTFASGADDATIRIWAAQPRAA